MPRLLKLIRHGSEKEMHFQGMLVILHAINHILDADADADDDAIGAAHTLLATSYMVYPKW